MSLCKCGSVLPKQITLHGKRRNLRNRTQCLTCLPFGESPYRKKTEAEKRLANTAKVTKWYDKLKVELGIDPANFIRKDRKKQVVDILGGKCSICGYDKCISNLVFHHMRDKDFPMDERRFQYSWIKLLPELLKCVLLCHNCHGEVHANQIPLERLVIINHESEKILIKFIPTRISLARSKITKGLPTSEPHQ